MNPVKRLQSMLQNPEMVPLSRFVSPERLKTPPQEFSFLFKSMGIQPPSIPEYLQELGAVTFESTEKLPATMPKVLELTPQVEPYHLLHDQVVSFHEKTRLIRKAVLDQKGQEMQAKRDAGIDIYAPSKVNYHFEAGSLQDVAVFGDNHSASAFTLIDGDVQARFKAHEDNEMSQSYRVILGNTDNPMGIELETSYDAVSTEYESRVRVGVGTQFIARKILAAYISGNEVLDIIARDAGIALAPSAE